MKPYSKEVKIYTGKTVRINVNSNPVDPDKFKKIFADKQIIVADVSRALGYAANTLSSALHAGVFSGPVIAGLKREYDVDYSDYAYNQEEKSLSHSRNRSKKKACAPMKLRCTSQ